MDEFIIEPEFMCTYDHLQFTQDDLPNAQIRSLNMEKLCSNEPNQPRANLVLAPSATGKTGVAIRTLCKRGGIYVDFHMPKGFSQFLQYDSLARVINNARKLPYTMSSVAVWVLAHVLHLAFLRRKHGCQAKVPDFVRAQLNGNRSNVDKIFDALIGKLGLLNCKLRDLRNLIKSTLDYVRRVNKNGPRRTDENLTFDVIVLDEAQVSH